MSKIRVFAAAALMLAGCSNDENSPQDNLKDTPITVTAGVAELNTRAGYDNSNLPETFYISIDQTGTNYDYTNVLMKNVNGTWKAYEDDGATEKTLFWASGTETVSVTAATFSLNGAQDLSVNDHQAWNDYVDESDHLYMATVSGVEPSAEGISVTFSHIMSKVILTITLGDEFDETTNPITYVYFQGTLASRNYNASTSDWTNIADVTATDIRSFKNSYKAIDIDNNITNATAEYEVILVPQTVAANGFAVKIVMNDRFYVWTSSNAVTLESGNKHTLALTVGEDKVSGGTFSSTAWNTGEEDSNKLSGETE